MIPGLQHLSHRPDSASAGTTTSADRTAIGQRLIIAWDYDQCLAKVVHGTYQEELTKHMTVVLTEFARSMSVTEIVLCSYSNRVSEFYNRNVQPIEDGAPDNFEALYVFGQNLANDHTAVTYISEYMIDGDEAFRSIWRAQHPDAEPFLCHSSGESYNSSEVKKWYGNATKGSSGVALKRLMYYATLQQASPGDIVLFIDDKSDNLSFIRSRDDVECYTLQMHATQVALYKRGHILGDSNPIRTVERAEPASRA